PLPTCLLLPEVELPLRIAALRRSSRDARFRKGEEGQQATPPPPPWMLQERKGESGVRRKRVCLHLHQNSPTHQAFETHQVSSPGLAGPLKLLLGSLPLLHSGSFWKPQDFLSSHSEEGEGEDSQNFRGSGTFSLIRKRN
ncbi:Hypothetical predicted protein, partial [Podarcis lilfordi]